MLADNPPDLVATVLEFLGIDGDLRLSINPRRTSRRLIALDREVSVRELLTHFVELRKPVTRSQLRRLAASNPCEPERERLEELAASADPCALSPLECLLEFPACALTGAELLELLEPMTPRHYSIASSSRLTPGLVALVVSVLDAPGPVRPRPLPGRGVQPSGGHRVRRADPGAGRSGPPGVPGRCRPRKERDPGQRGHRCRPVPRIPR